MNIEEQFHKKALAIYENGKRATGYRGTRYLQKVRKDGGVMAAKSWLKPKSRNDVPTGGFLKLVDFGRLDVSLEALVIEEPWRQLFTEDELQVAESRLRRYGYFDKWSQKDRDPVLSPEEVIEDTPLYEGAKKRITVNSYERNPKARKACIAHYKPICIVCGFDFGKKYGDLVDGFVHVHHMCTLSEIDGKYKVDPVADLRPVCPNCHAVIHLKEPPLKLEQVREMMRIAEQK